MDFFRRLKGLIPIVSASEPESGNVRNVEPEVVEEVLSESDTADSNPGDKVIDLSKKPEIFSDILVNRDSDYEYYPERLNGRYKPSLWNKVFKFEGKEEFTRMSCEKKLYKLIQEGNNISCAYDYLLCELIQWNMNVLCVVKNYQSIFMLQNHY